MIVFLGGRQNEQGPAMHHGGGLGPGLLPVMSLRPRSHTWQPPTPSLREAKI